MDDPILYKQVSQEAVVTHMGDLLISYRQHMNTMLLMVCLPFKIQYLSCKAVSVTFTSPCLACWCTCITSNLISRDKNTGFFSANDRVELYILPLHFMTCMSSRNSPYCCTYNKLVLVVYHDSLNTVVP